MSALFLNVNWQPLKRWKMDIGQYGFTKCKKEASHLRMECETHFVTHIVQTHLIDCNENVSFFAL